MLCYSCRSINIEYKWLCLGICIYREGQGRLSLVSQPAKVIEKLEWGRTGSGSTAALIPFPRLDWNSSLSREELGLLRVRSKARGWNNNSRALKAQRELLGQEGALLGSTDMHAPLPLEDHGSVGSPAMPWFLPSVKNLKLCRRGERADEQSSFMDGTMRQCLERGSGFEGRRGGCKYGRNLTQIVILYKEPRGTESFSKAVLRSGALCFRGQNGGDSEPAAYLTPEDSAGVIFISTRL